MECFKEVKNVIVNQLSLLEKAKPGSSKNVDGFFNSVASSLPLVKLYTKEGLEQVEELLFSTSDIQNEVTEFLLRIKPSIDSINGFYELCLEFNSDIFIIDKYYTKEFTKLNTTCLEDIKRHYILNIILAYNTAI